MEINLKAVTLILTILITGLSAGLFYAWKISVIPGLKNITDRSYLETMQSINRAILNPEFYIIFFGAILLLILSAYFQFKVSIDNSFWLIITAILFYGIGTIGVTAFGNVPMNESLDLVDLAKLNVEELRLTRLHYAGQWNQFNTIRTIFSILSFMAVLVSSFLNESIDIKI